MMENTAERPFTLASFQAYMNEGRLMGSRNRVTGEVFAPPRPIDPATHSDDMEWVELSGHGTLAAFTSVYIGTSVAVAHHDEDHGHGDAPKAHAAAH